MMEMAASREKEVFQKGFNRIGQAFNGFKGKSENVREKIDSFGFVPIELVFIVCLIRIIIS